MSCFKYGGKTIFILGAPRSGTTWLAKIFDAHPDVLYRHEPDILLRAENLPFMCDDAQIKEFGPQAAEWLDDLARNRWLKSSGTWPIFRKSYHSSWQTTQRRFLIIILKFIQQLALFKRTTDKIAIPDYINLDSNVYSKLVIKSVSSMGRAGLFAAAAPESRIILIVRHPCGQVASMLRGIRSAMFEDEIPLGGLPDTAISGRYGLTRESLMKESLVGQLAWNWVIQYEIALESLKTTQNVKIVRYIDLAENPKTIMRMLFEFCDLEWRQEVVNYIAKSTQGATGNEGYYDLVRDPIEAAGRWRRELTESDIDTIMRIASQSELGRPFWDDDAKWARRACSDYGSDSVPVATGQSAN